MTTQDPLAVLGQTLGQAGAQVAAGALQTAQQALPGIATQAQQAIQPAVQQLGQAAGQGFGQGARQGAFSLSLDDPMTWAIGAGVLALVAGVGFAAYHGGRAGREPAAMNGFWDFMRSRRGFPFYWYDGREVAVGDLFRLDPIYDDDRVYEVAELSPEQVTMQTIDHSGFMNVGGDDFFARAGVLDDGGRPRTGIWRRVSAL